MADLLSSRPKPQASPRPSHGAALDLPTFHGVTAREDFAKKRPAVLEAFLRAQAEATTYLHDHPLAAAQKVAKATDLPAEVVYLYNGAHGIATFDPALKPQLISALKKDVSVLKSAKLVGDVDVDAFVDDQYVKRALADALADPDTAVRVEAVCALVSIDAAEPLSRAAADPSREVRVTVAKALANVSPGKLVEDTLDRLTTDPDALVRAAAFATLAVTGCPATLAARAVAAQADAAWQVRSGAAAALSAAETGVTVPALAQALEDPNPDVRKAAVLALVRHSAVAEGARAALATATADSDADVRAYASRVL